ncbi:MAG: uroporphyrinogen decarboxylase family protein [Armatimonadota bacterium]|nr:uroporphyrinogen decarboxylase family protein [bacterium]
MTFSEYVKNAGRQLAAPLSGFPGTELTNTTVAQNLTDGSVQAATLIALNKALSFDIIFPMMDLTVETEALGATVNWETDEMPTIHGISVETKEAADALVIPEIGEGNRLNIYVDVCREMRNAFPDKLVWGYVLGPFSIAGRLMGMTEIAIGVKLEPETVRVVLAKANALLKKYIGALLDTGVDGVMILEPASGMLREDDANEFSNAYVKELVDLIKSRGRTPALHNCGNITHMIESLCATGIEALHVGSVTDPYEIYPRLPENVVLMGNIDPTEVLRFGTPETVCVQTRRLLDRMADCDRFIISSGCDVAPGTSIENMKTFERAAIGRECAAVR